MDGASHHCTARSSVPESNRVQMALTELVSDSERRYNLAARFWPAVHQHPQFDEATTVFLFQTTGIICRVHRCSSFVGAADRQAAACAVGLGCRGGMAALHWKKQSLTYPRLLLQLSFTPRELVTELYRRCSVPAGQAHRTSLKSNHPHSMWTSCPRTTHHPSTACTTEPKAMLST
jgi:hypothetical protein